MKGFLYLYICNAAKYAVDARMSAEAVSSEMSFFIAYPPLWVGVRGAARLKQIL